MKKKVLFYNGSLRMGGIERVLVEVLQNIDKSKIDVDLVIEDGTKTLNVFEKDIPKEIEIFYPTKEEIKDKKNIGDIQREIFLNLLEKKVALNNLEKLKVIISNSMKIFHELSIYLLVYIIDKILIEKFTEGKEIKMFMIFSNELAE